MFVWGFGCWCWCCVWLWLLWWFLWLLVWFGWVVSLFDRFLVVYVCRWFVLYCWLVCWKFWWLLECLLVWCCDICVVLWRSGLWFGSYCFVFMSWLLCVILVDWLGWRRGGFCVVWGCCCNGVGSGIVVGLDFGFCWWWWLFGDCLLWLWFWLYGCRVCCVGWWCCDGW